jgi:hypothetical protein
MKQINVERENEGRGWKNGSVAGQRKEMRAEARE